MTGLLMYAVTFLPLFVLRDRCEGLYYNTSYSAVVGDGGLIVVALLVAGIVQRGPFFLPGLVHSVEYQDCAIAIATLLGLVWFQLDHPQQWADRYHHLVIAPLLCYLGLTLVPIIYLNGTLPEKVSTVLLVLLWAGLVVYDTLTHRLDQRNYHALGFHLNEMKQLDE